MVEDGGEVQGYSTIIDNKVIEGILSRLVSKDSNSVVIMSCAEECFKIYVV